LTISYPQKKIPGREKALKVLLAKYSQGASIVLKMNVIEQLMVEHAAIRLRLNSIRASETNSDSIYDLDEFVIKCHARIEDDLVFPRLMEMLTSEGREELEKTLSRIEADHKLIQKISEQIKFATEKGDSEILRKRIMLYCTTVETHNLAEENLIFPYWKSEEKIDTKKIIDEFGRDRYFKITGVSQKLFDTFA
jgi:hemerythrin superfamily protein